MRCVHKYALYRSTVFFIKWAVLLWAQISTKFVRKTLFSVIAMV